jgi:hypothetical protein
VFAVGEAGLTLHYNGSSWTILEYSPKYRDLYDIWGFGSFNVYSAGELGSVIHFDGVSWSSIQTFITEEDWPGDIWASGWDDVFISYTVGDILHYDGSTWTKLIDDDLNTFYEIWGNSASDVYATGFFDYRNCSVLHYDGADWTRVELKPEILNTRAVWSSSSSDVFVGGEDGVMFHYDGVTWSQFPVGPDAYDRTYHHMWGFSSSNVYVLGYEPDKNVVVHYDGMSWTVVYNTDQYITDIWGPSPTEIYVLQNPDGIKKFDGTVWTHVFTPSCTLYGIHGTSSHDIYTVGTCHEVYHYDGVSWNALDISQPFMLMTVWNVSPNNVYTAGEKGIIQHFLCASTVPAMSITKLLVLLFCMILCLTVMRPKP